MPNSDVLIRPKIVKRGLSQGEPLGPMLFKLYTASIPKIIDNNTQILQYADDFCMGKNGSRKVRVTLYSKYTSIMGNRIQILRSNIRYQAKMGNTLQDNNKKCTKRNQPNATAK